MTVVPLLLRLGEAGAADRAVAGAKAATLAVLAQAGFPVPDGVVLTAAAYDLVAAGPGGTGGDLSDDIAAALSEVADRLGDVPLAVRSSALAEDLPGATFAGQYVSVLGVRGPAALAEAVRRCWASLDDPGAAAYARRASPGIRPAMAVLVQPLVAATAAGVALGADPLTGDRATVVVSAVPGSGEALVSGTARSEDWAVIAGAARCRSGDPAVLDAAQAGAVAGLLRRAEGLLGGPLDVEWAIAGGQVVLLQARPMTALPPPVSWAAPLPGGWLRCIRLGEWLPEPVTPLFETWLLAGLEEAFRRCQLADGGFLPPAPLHVLVHGWYFHSPVGNGSQWRLLAGLARRPRLGTAMALAPRSPGAADWLFYGRLAGRWRDRLLPRYRELVAAGERRAGPADAAGPADTGAPTDVSAPASPTELVALVDRVAAVAGECAWALVLCGGAAWRFEEALDRCCRRAGLAAGTSQVLTSGLGSAELPGHSVHSLDWLRETLGELPADLGPAGPSGSAGLAGRREQAAARRRAAQADGSRALAARPRRLARFRELTELAQRYAALREEQSRWLTLGWPLLRRCVLRLGELACADGLIETPGQVFFLTRAELDGWLRGQPSAGQPANGLAQGVQARRAEWERQRRLTAPLAVGRPPVLVAWLLRSAARQGADSRADSSEPGSTVPGSTVPGGTGPGSTVLRGTPASPGRATGPARVLRDPADAAAVRDGEILVVGATVPALTPLFGRIAGLCADSGSVAAHACLVAREYGIPAVTGLGDATARIADGALVTVDGTGGYAEIKGP